MTGWLKFEFIFSGQQEYFQQTLNFSAKHKIVEYNCHKKYKKKKMIKYLSNENNGFKKLKKMIPKA